MFCNHLVKLLLFNTYLKFLSEEDLVLSDILSASQKRVCKLESVYLVFK